MLYIEPLEARRLCASPVLGDANSDGRVDADDYALLDFADPRGDLNQDGTIDADDYAIIDPRVQPPVPDASNTGPTNRGILRVQTDGMVITQAGTVVENFHITGGGTVLIKANNVTLRNFIIEGPISTGAAIKFDSNDLTGGIIEDGEIFGGTATNGVAGSNYTARRLHIYNMQADAFRVKRNVTIESSYLHDFGQGENSHGDGVQMYPSDAASGNITIRFNRIDATGANAALFQVNRGWHVEGNLLDGGNYTIQCGGETGNIFINNTFGRGSKYGPIRVGSGDKNLLTWIGNVWAGTLDEVPL